MGHTIADYDCEAQAYDLVLRPDLRIAALVQKALGTARIVLNIAAETGSYGLNGLHVVVIEPSATLRTELGSFKSA